MDDARYYHVREKLLNIKLSKMDFKRVYLEGPDVLRTAPDVVTHLRMSSAVKGH